MSNPAVPVHDFSLGVGRRFPCMEHLRICDHGDCLEPATIPAPGHDSRARASEWFCPAHARERNRSWDCYRQMGPAEIEAAQRSALVWDRPTWPVGQSAEPRRHPGAAAGRKPGPTGAAACASRTATESTALAVLGLQAAATPGDVRTRFRALLRKLHPDLNPKGPVDSDRLRAVVWAWRTLRKAFAAKAR